MTKSRQTGDIISGLDAIPEGNLVSVDASGNPVDGGTYPDPVIPTNPNLLINGDFRIWQRGDNITTVGTEYTADRWTADGGLTVDKAGAESSNLVPYGLRINGTTASTGIAQCIELGAVGIAPEFSVGKSFTLSFYVVGNTSVDVVAQCRFTDDSIGNNPTATRNIGGTFAATTAFTRFEETFTIQDAPNGTNAAFQILIRTLTAGANVIITGVKLERGSVATPFIPDDPATNLAKCQRYYYSGNGRSLLSAIPRGSSAAGQATILTGSFPVTMRAAPTMPVVTLANINTGAVADVAPVATVDGFHVATGAVTATADQIIWCTDEQITAVAEL